MIQLTKSEKKYFRRYFPTWAQLFDQLYFGQKQLEKRARGYTEQKISTNLPKKIKVVGWNDNRTVYLASNVFHQIQLNQFVDGTKLKESTFKSTNPTSFIVRTKIWVLWIEWIKT